MLKSFALLVLVVFSSSAFSAEAVHIKVRGMVCSFCAQGIKKKMSALEGVETFKFDLDKKMVDLDLKPNAKISDDKLKEIIKDAGYDVEGITRTSNEK